MLRQNAQDNTERVVEESKRHKRAQRTTLRRVAKGLKEGTQKKNVVACWSLYTSC